MIKRNITKFNTVLLHSNWSSLEQKYLSKIPTDMNALSCGLLWAKSIKHLGKFRTPFLPRDIRTNPRSMYARVPHAMGQLVLKIEKLSHITIRHRGEGGAGGALAPPLFWLIKLLFQFFSKVLHKKVHRVILCQTCGPQRKLCFFLIAPFRSNTSIS